jgi:hypothetical protein
VFDVLGQLDDGGATRLAPADWLMAASGAPL